jgi:MFS family permease
VVLTATTFVQALVAMALLTLPVVAPEVAKDVGVSTAYLGVYVATVYLGAMIASLLGSAAVKRWGAIRLSQAGLLVDAIGLCLCAVPNPAVILLGAVLIGLGYGPITPASSHVLIKTTPANQLSFVFSIKQTGVPLGGMVAGAVIPSLTLWIGWQWSFIVSGLACALCAYFVQPLREELDDDRDPQVKFSLVASMIDPLRLVLQHRVLRLLAVCSFLFAICQMSLMAYLVTFLYEDLHWGLVAAGAALTLAHAAMRREGLEIAAPWPSTRTCVRWFSRGECQAGLLECIDR